MLRTDVYAAIKVLDSDFRSSVADYSSCRVEVHTLVNPGRRAIQRTLHFQGAHTHMVDKQAAPDRLNTMKCHNPAR
jgi:hypothetical protein